MVNFYNFVAVLEYIESLCQHSKVTKSSQHCYINLP